MHLLSFFSGTARNILSMQDVADCVSVVRCVQMFKVDVNISSSVIQLFIPPTKQQQRIAKYPTCH